MVLLILYDFMKFNTTLRIFKLKRKIMQENLSLDHDWKGVVKCYVMFKLSHLIYPFTKIHPGATSKGIRRKTQGSYFILLYDIESLVFPFKFPCLWLLDFSKRKRIHQVWRFQYSTLYFTTPFPSYFDGQGLPAWLLANPRWLLFSFTNSVCRVVLSWQWHITV